MTMVKASRRSVGGVWNNDLGRDVDVEALRGEIQGRLIVEAWTYGASLIEVSVPDRRGELANICLRLPDLESYLDPRRNHYVGCVMGRFARCVRHGRLALDGQVHQLTRNLGDHHFHGGARGFDKFVWAGDIERTSAGLDLIFRLTRPEGDEGYPGAVAVETRYRLMVDGSLVIEHRGRADAVTVLGMTSHVFWNLAGAGQIDDHRLLINAARYVDADAEFIPLPGPPRAVAGTDLDLRTSRRLGARRLDQCFVIEGAQAARLEHARSGRIMSLETDQPGLAVYTGDGLPLPRGGLCLQTGDWPDAPNRADFPSARLAPGETYLHRSRYLFSASG